MMSSDITKHLSIKRKKQLKNILGHIPIYLRKRPLYWYWRSFLNTASTWSKHKIETWQLQKIKDIVRYAYENTEGYRELYKTAGIHPRDIRILQDVRHLPFITKETLQNNLEAFSVKSPNRQYVTTGGSTGIPFGFYHDASRYCIEQAFIHTPWIWNGWKMTTLDGVLRGGYIGSENQIWEHEPLLNEINFSSYYLNEHTIQDYLDIIYRKQLRIIQAYPSSFNLFCDLIKSSHLMPIPKVELVLLGSENIYDWQINKFKEVFPQTTFHAWYGHAERCILAPWCEHERKYHLWPFYGYTEVLNESNQEVNEGQEGELVGTGFHSLITPFIRYRTMDRAVKGSSCCSSCGRNFQLLDKICGRSHEVIVTRTGRYISMTAINMHDDIFDNLRQFQFYQDTPGQTVFKYIPKRPLTYSEKLDIQDRLMTKLGSDMELLLSQVDDLPRTKAGKYRFLDQRQTIQHGDQN